MGLERSEGVPWFSLGCRSQHGQCSCQLEQLSILPWVCCAMPLPPLPGWHVAHISGLCFFACVRLLWHGRVAGPQGVCNTCPVRVPFPPTRPPAPRPLRRSMFWVDFISSVPWEPIVAGSLGLRDRETLTAKLVALLRWLRIGRMYPIFDVFAVVQHKHLMPPFALTLTRNYVSACLVRTLARMYTHNTTKRACACPLTHTWPRIKSLTSASPLAGKRGQKHCCTCPAMLSVYQGHCMGKTRHHIT